MAGIDILSPDISQPWFENGAVISKVNYSPELDGGEISRRHLRAWLEQLLPERGRIPIEIFVGSQSAWTAASLRWQQLLAGGLKAWLSSSTLTLAPSGQTHQLPWSDGYRRARALAMWADVDALVLTVTSQEFASSELPFERVDRVIRQDEWPPA
jgi:cyanophycin synthetase